MMSVDPNQAKSIFLSAVEDCAPEDWGAFLEKACGGDADLRRRVEALLVAHQGKDRLFDDPQTGLVERVGVSEPMETPGTLIRRYKLLEKIGEGGMAVVYMAEQEEPIRRKVALKIIKLGMDTRQVIARFEAERQALAMMDHPCIAKVLDAGATQTGRPYFVMELVQGVSITEYCDSNSLSTKDRLGLFIQVCNAVQHAHQKAIIHRDIKPSNIMVTHHDGKPVPKVIDFGIAKAINQKLTEKTLFTRYAHLIGTPAYMSPEQAELSDLDIDTRSDIYSLGVLLYELLTGTTPFSEEELRKVGYLEMQRVIREQEPVKPSTKISTLGDTSTEIAKRRSCTPELLRRAIRGDLDWIVMKSLEKDRVHRYETANALAGDVQRHLGSEPVLARAPSAPYRIRKFLRRHRSQVLAALVVAVTAIAATVLLMQWNRDRQRLEDAQDLRDRGILSQARELYAKADRKGALEIIGPILSSRHVGPEARLLQAGILVDDRRFDEATAISGSLLSERREIAGIAHAFLARILWESGSLDAEKHKQIEEHRRQAQMLLPETAEAYYLQAMTASTIKEQFAALDKALELDPRHYESRRLRAFTCYASRKYDRLRDDALVMTVLHDHDPLGYSLRATAGQELGRYTDAIADYNNAMALTPKDSPPYLDLATRRCEALLRMGDYERAAAEARDCSERWPDTPVFQYYRFAALTALGNYGKAADLFREIVLRTSTARDEFWLWVTKYVFDTLEARQSWHASGHEPIGVAFLPLVEAEETYRHLSTKARRITTNGFSAQWSPDESKLAFSLGVHGRSGVAIYDPLTKETDLLIVPGKDPRWSPDGRHIAFVRDCGAVRLEEFATAECKGQARWLEHEEVWVMTADGTEPRRLARGSWPSWSRDSTCVYYHSRADRMLYSISAVSPKAEPERIMACSDAFAFPSVSPDNQCIAYREEGTLKVWDLASQALVAEWREPFGTSGGPAWSPTGKELCLGAVSRVREETGLWIYTLDTNEPSKVLGSQVVAASWAPNGTHFVFHLRAPYLDIWAADLDPNVSAIESLGPARTLGEHFREMVALWTRRIETYPQDANGYLRRAVCYDSLGERAQAEADMRRWSRVIGGQSPETGLDTPTAQVDFTFGKPVNLEPTINHGGSNQAFPCLSANGRELYFCRAVPGALYDVFMTRRATVDSEWAVPIPLGSAVNTSEHEWGLSISADGTSLYFTYGGDPEARLYVTKRTTTNDDWGPPASIGGAVGTEIAVCPCISADDLELYFVSRRLKGYGDNDLWVTTRATVNDDWGTPVNLGAAINSPYLECDPVISADGLLLFFSSTRPGGRSVQDIYVSRRATRKGPWGSAVNPGPTLNSTFGQRPGSISSDGSMLYFFCSWPGGHGSRDIWRVPIIQSADSSSDGKGQRREDQR
jgi:serine/threonine protein kinase/Tol biopolymer transport system component